MKRKYVKKQWIFLLLAICWLTEVKAQSVWDNFRYPTVTVIDEGAGTNNSADAILNAIGFSQAERTAFYNARILSVVKRLYKNPQEVPNFTDLELVFDPNYCGGIAAKSGNPPRIRIQNSTHYLMMVLKQSKEELLAEIGGTLTHEVTHAYSHVPQNAGEYKEGTDFFGFIEGIADYVRLQEKYSTQADITIDTNYKWLKGYNGSAFFINYLNNRYPDFAYKLNQSCTTINPWSFKKATEQIVVGKSIEQLWNEYTTSVSNDRANISTPVANFNTNKTVVKVGEEVSITNTSTNYLESAWFYSGKSCVGFTNSKHFKIAFDTPGVYKITLEAKNYKGGARKEVTITVNDCGDQGNIAKSKPVTVSSTEKSEFNASNAVDGNENTRWSSNFSDNEWLTVDLQNSSDICGVAVSWFSCCSFMMGAKNYEVQTSENGVNWTTAKTIQNNFDNYNFIPVNGTGRYVRIKGIKRSAASFGYSINELKVYGGKSIISLPPSNTNQDLTQPGGAISESNNNSPSYESIANLIDNSSNTKYLTFNAAATVTYNFSKNYVLSGYTLTSANDAPERDPSSWVLEGSNDGTTWVEVDRRSNHRFSNRKEKKEFTFTTSLGFSKVRFKFNNTSGTVFQLAELEIFGKEGSITPPNGNQTDLTQPGGTISESNNNSPSYESIANLIDNSSNTKYLTFNPTTTVTYSFSKSYVLTGYSLTSANDAPERDPSSWVLEGSNNGTTWVEIDRRSNHRFTNRKEKKEFTFTTGSGFTKVRFKFNNTSGSLFQLAELEIFGNEGAGNVKLPIADFTANRRTINQNESVAFTNKSANGTHYLWTFEGGNPSGSTSVNPVVVYANAGIYKVTLKATNSEGSDTEIKNGYITVSGTGGTNCDWGTNFLTPNVIFKDNDGVTTGSRIFHQVIPNPKSYMQQRCLDVAKILYRKSADAPKFRQLTFELKNENFVARKYGDGDVIGIEVSTQHLARIYQNSGNNPQVIKDEIDGILYHEVTHGYNNSPIVGGTYDGSSPFWAYTEGIADAVRIHAGFHQTKKPDVNNSKKWLTGYATTGFFLHYVSQKYDKNFVYKFNKAAKSLGQSWSFDNAFKTILGKGVQEVWNAYAAFINNGGKLDYDGNYPWVLDCSESLRTNTVTESLEKTGNNTPSFKFYPNPIDNEVTIVYPKSKVTTVNIRSLQGIVLFSKAQVNFTQNDNVTLDINLPTGVYLLEIDGVVKKLIVKKFR
ncbi:basic secretory protein-like protein [Tenacibaculum sp. TC6]|uniref:basic secretory protein-like protein n=1 Tax=Tenacibaculum sp. TC6 TaxID=3423223 RepID=UPI003D3677BD